MHQFPVSGLPELMRDTAELVGDPNGGRVGNEPDAPYYAPVGDEVEVFEAAWRGHLAIMLKGPTGCGKTRLVEHMAFRLGAPVFTVPCHEDITTADLVGRYILTGGETVWVDGPLTCAVSEGGICYLDEIVEARQDSIVAIHPLTDHRRRLNLERRGNMAIEAADGFGIVISYNPGYQSILKDLKVSTRQRMVAIELSYPPADIEREIILHESGVEPDAADDLIALGQAIRRVEDSGLREVASTRTLIAAAILITQGLSARQAVTSAIVGPLTDDPALRAGLLTLLEPYLSDAHPDESR